ncbi:hypothetical protein SAMN05421748_1032 [Paractinoplanes atraurantiacus]|uniref:Uncharacterized protein n=1 Tax=Paractinoplanes atraurantiacus TaxID=1036182 RepID=A0A285GWY1_9ACTN|nr:hypothetical protein SAMN05421748_1032 [Actinoplanes atraurantiacus]
MGVALAVAPSLIVGFLAGLITLRAKNRWCGECGVTLRCPACAEGASWTSSN